MNVPMLLVMLWSGLPIDWASPVYRVELGSVTTSIRQYAIV